jgi:hypothetical protein
MSDELSPQGESAVRLAMKVARLTAERDEALAAAASMVERESGQPSRAKVWEEALEAVAWTMSTGGPPDLAYVAEHNPYRAASSEGA